MLKTAALLGFLFATSVAAQTTSYTTNRPAPIQGDADKIVCQKQEQIGSRLGAKKLCLTVREWRERHALDREHTEGVQAGVRTCSEVCTSDLGKVF